MGDAVFKLFATLGINTKEYDDGLEESEKKGASFGKGLKVAAGVVAGAIAATTAATVAGTKAFINSAKATAEMGDVIDKQSQKVGFSKKAWQEWDYVLNLAGSSMSAATMGIKTMTNQVDSAKKGNKEAISNFKALGISIKDLKTMSREDIFEKVISGLQKMPESTKRAALANKVLGRSGQDLSALFNMSNKETQDAIKLANDYGMVMSDKAVKASANFQDSLTTLKGAMTGLKNNMMSEFLPSLTTVMDGLSAVFSGKDTDKGMKNISDGLMSLIDNLSTQMPKFMDLGKTIIVSVLKGFAPMLPSLVSTIFDIGIQAITTVVSMVPQMMPTIITGIQGIMTALMDALPIIISGVTQLLMSLVQWLADTNNVQLLVNGVVQLVTQLVNSFADVLPILLPAIATIISELAKALTEPDTVMTLLNSVLTIIGALAVGIVNSLPILAKAVLGIIKNLGDLLSKFFDWAVPIAADGIEAIVNTVKSWGKKIATSVSNFFKDSLSNIGKFVTDILSKISELPSKVISIGSDIVKGLWNGISNMSKWIGEKIKGFGKGVLDGLKDFFKIKSPSRVFRDEVGKFIAMGVGEGFTDTMPNVIGDMKNSMSGITTQLNASIIPSISTDTLGGSTSQIMALIDAKLSNMEFIVPVYIGGKKIDQQIVLASARNSVVSGGR